MASSRIVGFNTESVTSSLVDIGTLILKSRESQCGFELSSAFHQFILI